MQVGLKMRTLSEQAAEQTALIRALAAQLGELKTTRASTPRFGPGKALLEPLK